jgi:hypothetical protein
MNSHADFVFDQEFGKVHLKLRSHEPDYSGHDVWMRTHQHDSNLYFK